MDDDGNDDYDDDNGDNFDDYDDENYQKKTNAMTIWFNQALAGGPGMDRQAVTSCGVVKISRTNTLPGQCD